MVTVRKPNRAFRMAVSRGTPKTVKHPPRPAAKEEIMVKNTKEYKRSNPPQAASRNRSVVLYDFGPSIANHSQAMSSYRNRSCRMSGATLVSRLPHPPVMPAAGTIRRFGLRSYSTAAFSSCAGGIFRCWCGEAVGPCPKRLRPRRTSPSTYRAHPFQGSSGWPTRRHCGVIDEQS